MDYIHIREFSVTDVLVDLLFGQKGVVDPRTGLVAGCGWILDCKISGGVSFVTHFVCLALNFVGFDYEIIICWPCKGSHRFFFNFVLKDET